MTSPPGKSQPIPIATVFLVCLAGILISGTTLSPQGLYGIFHEHSDFRSFYIGAKLFASRDIYNVDHVMAVQRELFWRDIPDPAPGSSSVLLRVPFSPSLDCH